MIPLHDVYMNDISAACHTLYIRDWSLFTGRWGGGGLQNGKIAGGSIHFA